MALKTSQAITSNVSAYKTAYRQVMQWLQGSGNLVIGDSQDSFYEVQKIEISTDQRIVLQYGELEATFTVYPFEFLNTGNTAVSSYSSLANDGDECAPLYRIIGTGSGSLTVNGHTMAFSANTGELYIDIRRKIAYNANGVNQNSVISGDYDDMRLQHGTNSISVSGGSLKVYPKWGFKI
jgi:phage-related protein